MYKSKSGYNQKNNFTLTKRLISVNFDMNRICTSAKKFYVRFLFLHWFSAEMLWLLLPGFLKFNHILTSFPFFEFSRSYKTHKLTDDNLVHQKIYMKSLHETIFLGQSPHLTFLLYMA